MKSVEALPMNTKSSPEDNSFSLISYKARNTNKQKSIEMLRKTTKVKELEIPKTIRNKKLNIAKDIKTHKIK